MKVEDLHWDYMRFRSYSLMMRADRKLIDVLVFVMKVAAPLAGFFVGERSRERCSLDRSLMLRSCLSLLIPLGHFYEKNSSNIKL